LCNATRAKKYKPGAHLIESAHFAPMILSMSASANFNPKEGKKVPLAHASILSAVEAEMGRIYLDSRRSLDGSNDEEKSVPTAQQDWRSKCSNTSGMHYSSVQRSLRHVRFEPSCPVSPSAAEKTLVQQHGSHAASTDLGKNGESFHVGIFAADSDLITDNLAAAAVSMGSVGHDRGLCKPCAFFPKRGCSLGASCTFCHLCEAGERKRRKKKLQEYWQGVVTARASK